MVSKNLIEQAEKFIRAEFKKYSGEHIYYHNLDHTIDVVETSAQIARSIHLNSTAFEELIIAAWFHDIGHMHSCIGHETISIEKLKSFLTSFGTDQSKINHISDCIRATELPQSPINLIGEILCDADLHHLGTTEFQVKSDLLRKELELNSNCIFSDVEWIQKNISFLKVHHYFTDFAKIKFGIQKAINLKHLEENLARLLK